MPAGFIPRRYAKALFDIAQEQEKSTEWLTDVKLIADVLGNPAVLSWTLDPKVTLAEKEQVLRDSLAEKVQPEAINYALLLISRSRASLAPAIGREYERFLNQSLRQETAIVTTAVPIDEPQKDEIIRYLENLTGKRIMVETRVDPEILGGVVARYGDELLDGSVRTKLLALRQRIALNL